MLNNKIVNLKDEIANLNSQISNLTGQVTNLKSAYLVAALGAAEIPYNSSLNWGPTPYNHLYITGSVNNTGEGTAYNAGLRVVAYYADGTLGVNMTVPLSGGIFGTDAATQSYVSTNYGSSSDTTFNFTQWTDSDIFNRNFSRRHGL